MSLSLMALLTALALQRPSGLAWLFLLGGASDAGQLRRDRFYQPLLLTEYLLVAVDAIGRSDVIVRPAVSARV